MTTLCSNNSTSAARKRRQREKALATYSVRTVTIDVTPSELRYLRTQFLRTYGHDWTLRGRRDYRAKTTRVTASAPKGSNQGELFPNEISL